MVKIGFIVEGDADKIILESPNFKQLLSDLSLQNIGVRIKPGKGGGKGEIKRKLNSYLKNLRNKQAEYIFIIADQDENECPLKVVNEIKEFNNNIKFITDKEIFIIAKKMFESWFWADKQAFSKLTRKTDNRNPEYIQKPDKELLRLLKAPSDSHVLLAYEFKEDFKLENAAKNSETAGRFYEKLKTISPKPQITFCLSLDVKNELKEEIFRRIQPILEMDFNSKEEFLRKLQDFGHDILLKKNIILKYLKKNEY